MTRAAIPVLLATLACVTPATLEAQLIGTRGSVGVIGAAPGGDFGDVQTNGFGAYAKLEASAVLIGVAAEVNVIRFGGKDFPDGGSTDAETIFGAQVGPRISFLLGKAGVDLGYYTQSDGIGWGPVFTFALGPLEVGASATFVEYGRWFSLRGGVRF